MTVHAPIILTMILFQLAASLGGCAATSNNLGATASGVGQKVTTFLMFEGQAEEAMRLYESLFDDARIESIERYGPGQGGPVGSIYRAVMTIDGQPFMFFDSPVKHAFTFTPSISLFVHCDSVEEVDTLFARLSEGGEVLMPLQEYPFSPRFAWVTDRFGVSWQLYLDQSMTRK